VLSCTLRNAQTWPLIHFTPINAMKNRFCAPLSIPFSLTALSLAVVMLVLSGCASSGGPKSMAVTPNPFAIDGAASGDQVKVNALRVFGDSYSDPGYTGPNGILNWASALQGSGYVSRVENYAIGGARAQFSQTTSFDRQLATWRNRNSAIAERDLSVTYFGYNDVGRNGRAPEDFAASKAGYTEGVNQLVQAGAAGGTNRIFVTQIHDWSRNPGVNPRNTQSLIVDLNNHVAGLANSNPNIIAVDLYTVFNRILNDPTKYGFNIIDTEDPMRHTTDALFYDAIHFGSRGMEIVARTYAHYLTRAWNWANAIEAGSAAAAQLNQDIDQGLLVLSLSENGKTIPDTSFSLVPLGVQSQSPTPDRMAQRRSFNHYASGNTAPAFTGMALNFNASDKAWTGASQMGLALHQKNASTQISSTEIRSSMGFQSHAASLYWIKPMSDFLFTTHLSQASQRFSQTASDELILRTIDNTRQGNSWSFESKLRYTVSNPMFTVTPWASFTQTRQSLDAGTLKTLYTSDVHFDTTKSTEWFSGVGMDFQFSPINLAGGRKLQLGGSLMHRESLKRDGFVVNMREAAQPLIVQRELIDRAHINQTYLGLNAQMDLTRHWNLSASYAANVKQTRQTQAVQLRANAHF